MARPKNQKQRRRDLIAAAQRAIATRGLGALRLKDVAEEAGVTGPAVSYYYPDLDDLLVDVYRRMLELSIEEGPSVIAGVVDPWEQMVALIDADFPDGPDDIDAIITYQFSGEPRFSKTYAAMSSALHAAQVGRYRPTVDAGITQGTFRPDIDPAAAVRAIIALGDAYGLQVVVGEPGASREEAVTEVIEIAASLLRAER